MVKAILNVRPGWLTVSLSNKDDVWNCLAASAVTFNLCILPIRNSLLDLGLFGVAYCANFRTNFSQRGSAIYFDMPEAVISCLAQTSYCYFTNINTCTVGCICS